MHPGKTSVLFTTIAPKPSTVPGDSQEYLSKEERKILKEITGIFVENYTTNFSEIKKEGGSMLEIDKKHTGYQSREK